MSGKDTPKTKLIRFSDREFNLLKDTGYMSNL
jgi:hypothetical protein